MEVGTESNVSFYLKVSSESNYDKLHFKVDGEERNEWSGEIAWTMATYALTPGTHELRWEYTKDVSVSSGSDCAWIDDISFPPSIIISEIKEETTHAVTLFPNPNNGSFSINLPEEDCNITVFNSLGQIMHHCQGNGLTTLNLNHLGKGMYFVTVTSANQTTTRKFIKE